MVLVDCGWSATFSDMVWPGLYDVDPRLWWMLFVFEVVLEACAGLYLADMVSGIVHLCLDYEVGGNDDLRRHAEFSIDDVKEFEKVNPLFLEAKKRDQYLWNFHVHHDATYPAADSNWELFMQMVVPAAPWYLLSIALAVLGILPPTFTRFWLIGVGVAMFTQFTHFAAHARNRGLIKNRLVCKLQDWHLLLNPETHKSHHIHFDRDFCILNGWANPVVNRIRRLGSHVGLFPKEAPTTTTRREREERAAVDGPKAPAADPEGLGHPKGVASKGGGKSKYLPMGEEGEVVSELTPVDEPLD